MSPLDDRHEWRDWAEARLKALEEPIRPPRPIPGLRPIPRPDRDPVLIRWLPLRGLRRVIPWLR